MSGLESYANLRSVMEEVTAKNASGKAVMNMSLGGLKVNSINRAVEELRLAGVVPVVAAGNENVSHTVPRLYEAHRN